MFTMDCRVYVHSLTTGSAMRLLADYCYVGILRGEHLPNSTDWFGIQRINAIDSMEQVSLQVFTLCVVLRTMEC